MIGDHRLAAKLFMRYGFTAEGADALASKVLADLGLGPRTGQPQLAPADQRQAQATLNGLRQREQEPLRLANGLAEIGKTDAETILRLLAKELDETDKKMTAIVQRPTHWTTVELQSNGSGVQARYVGS